MIKDTYPMFVKNYSRTAKGSLMNSPYVDNSYKWAGGGFLSTVGDLTQFANAMLYSFQYRPSTLNSTNENNTANLKDGKLKSVNINVNIPSSKKTERIENRKLPGFLNNKTIEAMWQPVAPTYGMGWCVTPAKQECQFCENNDFCVYHTGGAIGASSILFILPKNITKEEYLKPEPLPKGIVVAVICNMQSVGLSQTALKIAKEFENL